MKNLHKKGTIVERSDLMRAACRAYRGINGAELDRILGRLLDKGYIAQGMNIIDSKNKSRMKRTRIYYVMNMQMKEYDYEGARVETPEEMMSDAERKYKESIRIAREKFGKGG